MRDPRFWLGYALLIFLFWVTAYISPHAYSGLIAGGGVVMGATWAIGFLGVREDAK